MRYEKNYEKIIARKRATKHEGSITRKLWIAPLCLEKEMSWTFLTVCYKRVESMLYIYTVHASTITDNIIYVQTSIHHRLDPVRMYINHKYSDGPVLQFVSY
jgi:hypothetical protein